jgi:hypothetical protein
MPVPITSNSQTQTGKRVFAHWLLGAVVALIALAAVSRFSVNKMAYGDGLIYRYVASHLTTPPRQIDRVISDRGTSVRYGRIGFPALIWLGAAGQRPAMPYSQAALIVLSAGAAGAATALLVPTSGLLGSLLPFIAPGFALSVVGGYGEVVAVALALWAVILARREHWWGACSLLACAMLTRENAGAVLIGLIVWELIRRRPRAALILATSVIPLAAWYLFVDARFGHIPLFDPYLHSTTDTIAIPFIAIGRSLTHGPVSSIATAAIHLGLAFVALWLWRHSMLAIIAAAASLQVFSSGVFAWHFVGDAMRAFTFLEVFLLLAVLQFRWHEQDPVIT